MNSVASRPPGGARPGVGLGARLRLHDEMLHLVVHQRLHCCDLLAAEYEMT
jgi:hypothetical protein